MITQSSVEDYRRIEKAILYLEKHGQRQPNLKEVAQSINLSAYHFQRLFRRWAGISPKRFLQVLTVERAKELMSSSGSLLDVTYQAGMSSAGRLHDLFVNVEAVSPGEFRKKGEALAIRYGFHPSPFGECLVAVTDRGVTDLAFVGEGNRSTIVCDLKKQWPFGDIVEDPPATRPYARSIFGTPGPKGEINLLLKGTNFQVQVWKALLRIPPGSVTSYEDIAARINRPTAVRAVAGAVARNPVAFLIPCHRVIRKTGVVGDYRWGTARKKAILAWEAGHREEHPCPT